MTSHSTYGLLLRVNDTTGVGHAVQSSTYMALACIRPTKEKASPRCAVRRRTARTKNSLTAVPSPRPLPNTGALHQPQPNPPFITRTGPRCPALLGDRQVVPREIEKCQERFVLAVPSPLPPSVQVLLTDFPPQRTLDELYGKLSTYYNILQHTTQIIVPPCLLWMEWEWTWAPAAAHPVAQ